MGRSLTFISTTKAEKEHLKREMERDGRDTSHMDLREQRQYLHDRFVDYNREREVKEQEEDFSFMKNTLSLNL